MRRIATLFDFNGVLVDDEAVHFAAFRDVVRPLGIDLDEARYNERYLGFDDIGAFQAMMVDAGMSPTHEDVMRLVEAKKPVYMSRIAGALVVFDGAAELVRRRAERGTVGIVSGALRHEIEYALRIMDVEAHVAFIVSAEDTTACKPDPDGYRKGVVALGGEPRGVVALEDSLAGIASAKAAGIRCAAVAHSYPADKLAAAGADVVVARLAELDDARLDGEG